jgi:2'-5' RNA ligase
MKHVFLYESWLNAINEDKGKHSSACAMLYLKCSLEEIQSQIKEDDIYRGKEGDKRSYGLEDKPHVTLLYGLENDKVDPDKVMKICTSFEYTDIRLHNISLFEGDDYDVLKFDADSEVLHQINAALSKLPHHTDFPDYHPHATIAYLKAGTGKDYVKKFEDVEMEVEPSKIVYSMPDGDKIENSVIRYIDQNKDTE